MADEIEMALEEMKQKLQALATKYKAVRQEKAGQLGSAAAKAPQPAPASTQPKTEPAPSNGNGQLKTEFDKISAQVKQFQQTKDRDERERMAFELGQLVENWEDLYKAADEPSKKAAAPLLGNVQNLKAQLGKFTVPKGNQPASNQATNETKPADNKTAPKSETTNEGKPADNKTNDSRLKAAFDETFKASYERIEQTNQALDAEKNKAKREKIAFELGKHIENWEDLYNAADEAIKPLAAQQQATIQTMKAKLKGENMPASTPPAQGESPQNKDNTTTNPAKENAAKPSANSLSGSVGVGGKNAEADVRRIQNLLNRHGIRPALQESGKIDDQTITNIKKFQEIKTGVVDGLVEPDQNTWKALLGQKVEKMQTTPAPAAPAGETPAADGGKMAKPNWIKVAEGEMGVTEIVGGKHNPRVIEYHASTTGKFKTDEVPWCSSFVNWVMTQAGYKGTNSAWAQDWAKWGQRVSKPAYGAIAVLGGSGHVGFVVGKKGNSVILLGGNQGNMVKLSAFGMNKVIAYVFPTGYQVPANAYSFGKIDGDFKDTNMRDTL